jgi:hypothetical protein
MLGRTRRAKPGPTVRGTRVLDGEDLALIQSGVRGLNAPTVQKIRESHHRVARLMAMGLRPYAVAEQSGYSYQRVWLLSKDPAFQELVAKYREDVDGEWRQEVSGYYANANKARDISMRMVLEQLEEADEVGEKLPIRTLAALHGDLADRTGYGKRSTQVNVNLDFAARLDAAVKRSEQAKLEGKVIDIDPFTEAAE